MAKRSLVWVALCAVLAGWLCFVPLFNFLSYAFCLAMAVIVSLASAHLGAFAVTRARRTDEGLLLDCGPNDLDADYDVDSANYGALRLSFRGS